MKLFLYLLTLGSLLLLPIELNRGQSSSLDGQIHALTTKLYSTRIGNTNYGPSIATQREVREGLLDIAHESSEGRNRVVQALIELLEDVITKESNTTAWYVGADLLGQLKANEAIDILVTYLDYTSGTTGYSLAHIPSAKALVEIGKPAVPKLIQALFYGKSLLSEDDAGLREGATRALGQIGGPDAKQALKEALEIERDKTVIFHIEGALRSISEESLKE